MTHYRALAPYLRETFGAPVYKLALDGGCTCPTRDGTLDTRGCIFCSGAGSGDFTRPGPLEEQWALAKKRIAFKHPNGLLIPYFQSYSNTYGPVSRLEPMFQWAINQPETAALSIATRPDCLQPSILEMLQRLAAQKPLWVELGLQSIHPASALWMRRGYTLPVFDQAVKELKAVGCEVIVHMILGLPGETADDMSRTARYIGRSGASGIKLQLLHVLRGTDLAGIYETGGYIPLTLPAYISALEACLAVLPPEMVIHRLTGDGPKKDLLAPLWSADKKRVLSSINIAFEQDGVIQGSGLAESN